MSTIPVLRSCEYVIGKLMLLNQLTLRSGQFTEISGWIQQCWKSGKEGREGQSLRFGNAALLMVKVEGATSPEMPPASESWKQPGNGSSPRTCRRRCSCWCLDVGPGTPFQTGDLQKPQILSLYCLKSLGLWLFAIATNKNNDMGTSDRRVNASFL